MDKIAKLDSSMQRGLDNSFAFVFGGGLVPAEIEELLKQETEDNLLHTYEGSIEAPNVYRVFVSKKDAQTLSTKYPHLPSDFADRLTRFHRNNNWVSPGPVSVTIETDKQLRSGQLRARSETNPQADGLSDYLNQSEVKNLEKERHDDMTENNSQWNDSQWSWEPNSAPAQPQGSVPNAAPQNQAWSAPQNGSWSDPAAPQPQNFGAPQETQWPATEQIPSQPINPQGSVFGGAPQATPAPAQPVKPAVTLLLQDGSSRSYLVHEGSNIIGRSTEADLRLPDTGVSRQHAEITWNGHDAILVDLQSTNGTTVNDIPIDNWLLADGDVISVGHSNIEVRINKPA